MSPVFLVFAHVIIYQWQRSGFRTGLQGPAELNEQQRAYLLLFLVQASRSVFLYASFSTHEKLAPSPSVLETVGYRWGIGRKRDNKNTVYCKCSVVCMGDRISYNLGYVVSDFIT